MGGQHNSKLNIQKMSIYKYYKKEKELRTFNSVKYYVMSLVLDILVRKMVVNSITKANEVEIPFKELMQEIRIDSTFDIEWKLSAARVELIVAEMSWMNLIVNTGETSKNPNIKLTAEGFAAYKDQRFHSIAASLMEAKESRLLATIAIVVSFVTLIATIISIWCN
jgi:hypothetical protein